VTRRNPPVAPDLHQIGILSAAECERLRPELQVPFETETYELIAECGRDAVASWRDTHAPKCALAGEPIDDWPEGHVHTHGCLLPSIGEDLILCPQARRSDTAPSNAGGCRSSAMNHRTEPTPGRTALTSRRLDLCIFARYRPKPCEDAIVIHRSFWSIPGQTSHPCHRVLTKLLCPWKVQRRATMTTSN
jgi:hypothetical protein